MFLQKNKILLIKEEETYGSDPTPTVGDNAVLCMEPQVKENYEENKREPSLRTLGNLPSVKGKVWAELTFSFNLRGATANGTAPEIADLLEAFGLAETVSAGSSVAYQPSTQNLKSVTAYLYELNNAGSAVLKKLTGAVGQELKLTAEAGKLAIAECTLVGLYDAVPADVADPGAVTYDDVDPARVANQSISLNSDTSLLIQKAVFTITNEASPGDSVSATNGINDFAVARREVLLELNPEQELVSGYDFRGDWLANPRAFSMDIGSGASKVTLSAPKCNIVDITPGDKEGRTVDEIKAQLAIDSGDDEFTLTFGS
jgi:hypothetical protein